MDPIKIYQFSIDYILDWSRITFYTLINPIALFEPFAIENNKQIEIVGTDKKKYWLHPNLLGFAVLSIILGLTINAMIPNRKPSPDLFASVIIVLIYWIINGSFLHLFCKLFKGKGKYLETLSIAIQVFATLYVINSFLTLLTCSIILHPEALNFLEKSSTFGSIIVENPIYVFFIIGILLSMIYVPISLKPIHRFGWLRTFIITLFSPATLLFFGISIYEKYGIIISSSVKVVVFDLR